MKLINTSKLTPLLSSSSDTQAILRGAATAFLLKVLGTGLSFVFNVFVARTLGAREAGIFFLAVTLTTVAAVVGRVGLSNTLLRFVATNAAIGDWQKVKGICRQGMTIALFFSVLISIVLFVAAPQIAEQIFSKPELSMPLRWLSFSIPALTILNLYSEMLKGRKKIILSLLVQVIGVPGASLLLALCLTFFWGLNGIIGAYICSTIIIAFVSFMFWRDSSPELRNITGQFQLKELCKSNLPLFVFSLVNLSVVWFPTLFLGVWVSSSELAIFIIANRTAMLVSVVLVSFNSVIAPRFAALHAKKDMNGLVVAARQATKMMTFFSAPLVLFLFLCSDWVMAIFGSEFVSGAYLLSVLAVGQFVNAATSSVGLLLIMTGKEAVIMKITILSGLCNVVFCFCLIPHYGPLGASIAVIMTLIIKSIVYMFVMHNYLGTRVC